MAFDRLELIVRPSKADMPASVTLSPSKGGRPRCRVALSAALMTQSAIKNGEKVDVLLGTGDQKGLLRLVRSKRGVATVVVSSRSKAGFVSLGYIERFGTEPEPKQFCHAEMIDADTIEIVLPPWSQEQDV